MVDGVQELVPQNGLLSVLGQAEARRNRGGDITTTSINQAQEGQEEGGGEKSCGGYVRSKCKCKCIFIGPLKRY